MCVHVCLPPPLQGFNEGLEEVCKTQKVWAVPDKEQRDFIRQAQKKVVSQAYTYFLHRWDATAAHQQQLHQHTWKWFYLDLQFFFK